MAKKEKLEGVAPGALHTGEERKIVVVHHDTELDGETLKAGVHDLPVDKAASLVDDEKAHGPGGKGKGR